MLGIQHNRVQIDACIVVVLHHVPDPDARPDREETGGRLHGATGHLLGMLPSISSGQPQQALTWRGVVDLGTRLPIDAEFHGTSLGQPPKDGAIQDAHAMKLVSGPEDDSSQQPITE